MKIGHFQCIVKPDALKHNLDQCQKAVDFAEENNLTIISLPECCITGYVDQAPGAKRNSLSIDSAPVRKVLKMTVRSKVTLIAGLNEMRGGEMYNTSFVAEKGKLAGVYSKVFAFQKFHKRGDQFPVFEKDGVKYGVIICADGGYIEPTRILAIKGAKIIFAPHYNFLSPGYSLKHLLNVRIDHAARAAENGVWFVRGNNYVPIDEPDPGMSFRGVATGDSYIMDPQGDILVRSHRQGECFVHADIDLAAYAETAASHLSRSVRSSMRFAKDLADAIAAMPNPPKP